MKKQTEEGLDDLSNEEVQNEEVIQLKNNVKTATGAIARKYIEIDKLLVDNKNLQFVKKEEGIYKDLIFQYNDAINNYLKVLDDEDEEDQLLIHMTENLFLNLFQTKLANWITQQEQTLHYQQDSTTASSNRLKEQAKLAELLIKQTNMDSELQLYAQLAKLKLEIDIEKTRARVKVFDDTGTLEEMEDQSEETPQVDYVTKTEEAKEHLEQITHAESRQDTPEVDENESIESIDKNEDAGERSSEHEKSNEVTAEKNENCSLDSYRLVKVDKIKSTCDEESKESEERVDDLEKGYINEPHDTKQMEDDVKVEDGSCEAEVAIVSHGTKAIEENDKDSEDLNIAASREGDLQVEKSDRAYLLEDIDDKGETEHEPVEREMSEVDVTEPTIKEGIDLKDSNEAKAALLRVSDTQFEPLATGLDASATISDSDFLFTCNFAKSSVDSINGYQETLKSTQMALYMQTPTITQTPKHNPMQRFCNNNRCKPKRKVKCHRKRKRKWQCQKPMLTPMPTLTLTLKQT